jgi:hypothetical protein
VTDLAVIPTPSASPVILSEANQEATLKASRRGRLLFAAAAKDLLS